MKAEYSKKHNITYTEVSQNLKMDLISALNLIQDMMTEYFESFKSDNVRLKKNNKAIWVVTKTKVKFNKYPGWNDLVKGKGYTILVKPIRIGLEIVFKNKEEEILFGAKQECCVIDLETRKLRKINTVDYPENLEVENSIFNKPYLRLKEEFTEEDYVYRQKVYSSDIDYSRHTNNVSYVRYIVNALPSKFFDENIITDFEIHYINESKEGQMLKIYKKQKENKIDFLIKQDETEIIRARLSYKKV